MSFHEDGDGFPGGSQVSRLHQPVVQPRVVDDLSRMPKQFSNPAEDHRLLRVVLQDLLALLTQLLNHGRYLFVQVRVLRVHPVELLLVRLLRQLPENVSGSAVVQGLVCSPGDVLELEVLGM